MSSNSVFNTFSTSKPTFEFSDFMNSDSLVLKIAFVLLILFMFVILLRVGINILAFFLQRSDSPHLFDGMIDAKQLVIYPQDPSNNTSVTIYRSVNANEGIEFTWSVWIYINDLQYQSDKYRHIFYKGNSNLDDSGLNFPNNAPGLYIAPNSNNLVVKMNTFAVINQEIVVPDIPINKWVNIIVKCKNTTLDVYINGTIARSVELQGVPKQNYGDVYVAMNGGFDGYISNLWYFNYALGTAAIQRLVSNGPNRKMIGKNGINLRKPDYLSLRWYLAGSNDMFNP